MFFVIVIIIIIIIIIIWGNESTLTQQLACYTTNSQALFIFH
jgi:hypothetical protein